MAKLPEGRSTLTDEQMIGLTHRLVDTCIDCKGRIEELEERLKAAEERAEALEELVMDVVADLREGVSASKIDYRIGKVMQKLEWNE